MAKSDNINETQKNCKAKCHLETYEIVHFTIEVIESSNISSFKRRAYDIRIYDQINVR